MPRMVEFLTAAIAKGLATRLLFLVPASSVQGATSSGPEHACGPRTRSYSGRRLPATRYTIIGRRYAGFTWELVQQLKQANSDDEAFSLATRLVLGAAAANPTNIPDAVRLSFVVDAPDGNPSHGSPHFHELAAAANSPQHPAASGSPYGGRRHGVLGGVPVGAGEDCQHQLRRPAGDSPLAIAPRPCISPPTQALAARPQLHL